MHFQQIYDPGLSQYAYLIGCEKTNKAILLDAQRDVDRYLELAERLELEIIAVAETHIHADFLAGTREAAQRTGAQVLVSAMGEEEGWSYEWARGDGLDVRLLRDGDRIPIGKLSISVAHVPGHTPEHVAFLVSEPGASGPAGAVTGDFVFAGDLGRPDLLESAAGQSGEAEKSARSLFRSAREFLGQPDHLLIWPGHGAGSACGKSMGNMPHSTMGYEKDTSAGLKAASKDEDTFLKEILSDQPDPPLYFGQMKELNRKGVPALRRLPRPERLSLAELKVAADDENILFIDTNPDRVAFMKAHLPGALYAPIDSTFCTVVGSLVTDTDRRIVLIAEERELEDAARRLARIGHDELTGYVEPRTQKAYFDGGGKHASIDVIDFAQAEKQRQNGATIVDVRSTDEYEDAHVPDAIHAPYTRLPERLQDVPRSGALLVHCGSGVRAARATAYLAAQGRKVTLINDLFENYRKVGDTVSGEKDAA